MIYNDQIRDFIENEADLASMRDHSSVEYEPGNICSACLRDYHGPPGFCSTECRERYYLELQDEALEDELRAADPKAYDDARWEGFMEWQKGYGP